MSDWNPTDDELRAIEDDDGLDVLHVDLARLVLREREELASARRDVEWAGARVAEQAKRIVTECRLRDEYKARAEKAEAETKRAWADRDFVRQEQIRDAARATQAEAECDHLRDLASHQGKLIAAVSVTLTDALGAAATMNPHVDYAADIRLLAAQRDQAREALARAEALCERTLRGGMPADPEDDIADWGAKNLAGEIRAAITGPPTSAGHAYIPGATGRPDYCWAFVGEAVLPGSGKRGRVVCARPADDPIHQVAQAAPAAIYLSTDCVCRHTRNWHRGHPVAPCTVGGCQCASFVASLTTAGGSS